MVGGHDGFVELSTSEFISLDKPVPVGGPNLPFTISWHCMVQYNSNSIYIIGGKQNGSTSNKTWIVNPNKFVLQDSKSKIQDFDIREGPPLRKARAYHSCGKMEVNGKVLLVVAGGEGKSYLDSVEILDPTSNKGWIKGII